MMNPLNEVMLNTILKTGGEDIKKTLEKIHLLIESLTKTSGQNGILIPIEMIYVYYEEYKSLEKLTSLLTGVALNILNDFLIEESNNNGAHEIIEIIKSFEEMVKFNGKHFKKFGKEVIPDIHDKVFE